MDRGVDGTLQSKAGGGAGVEASEEAGISSYQAHNPGKHLGRSTILAGETQGPLLQLHVWHFKTDKVLVQTGFLAPPNASGLPGQTALGRLSQADA